MEARTVTREIVGPAVTLTVTVSDHNGKPLGGAARFKDGYACEFLVGQGRLALFNGRGVLMQNAKRAALVQSALDAPPPPVVLDITTTGKAVDALVRERATPHAEDEGNPRLAAYSAANARNAFMYLERFADLVAAGNLGAAAACLSNAATHLGDAAHGAEGRFSQSIRECAALPD